MVENNLNSINPFPHRGNSNLEKCFEQRKAGGLDSGRGPVPLQLEIRGEWDSNTFRCYSNKDDTSDNVMIAVLLLQLLFLFCVNTGVYIGITLSVCLSVRL